MEQKELSAALKGIVLLCLAAIIILCGVLLPNWGAQTVFIGAEQLLWPYRISLWLVCLPVLAVLVLVWRMAGRIGADNSFCVENAQALKCICLLAVGDTALYLVRALVFTLALRTAPPILVLLVIGVLLVGVAISVVAAVLSHLIQKAAELKAEQDLTI